MDDSAAVGVGVEHETHAAEVDLELDPGFAVGHADGLLVATARPAQLGTEALERPLGRFAP
jgi:hypothetical protein